MSVQALLNGAREISFVRKANKNILDLSELCLGDKVKPQRYRILFISFILVFLAGLTVAFSNIESSSTAPFPALGQAHKESSAAPGYPPLPGALSNQSTLSATELDSLVLEGQFGGTVTAMATQGNYAFVGIGLRLVILNISDPSTPLFVGETPYFPDQVNDVAVLGNYAFVACDRGLRVVDITDPGNPTVIGFHKFWYALGVDVVDNYVYIAEVYGGFHILDVADPSNPKLLGTYNTGYGIAVAVSGNYAYVASGGYGLRIININDPSNPYETGYYIPASPYIFGFNDVAIGGNHAYVTDTWSFYIIDISNPAKPTFAGAHEIICAHAVEVDNDYAYIADCGGLNIIDVADPSRPYEAGLYGLESTPSMVAIDGNYAFTGESSGGLNIIDVSTPNSLNSVGFFKTLSSPETMVVDGELAYVAASGSSGNNGLWIVDITNPASPLEISYYETPDAHDLVVSEDIVYLAARGLSILDVSDPAKPVEVAYFNTRGGGEGIALDGDYVYIADVTAGLSIIDISDLESPFEVGVADSPGRAYKVALSNNYAYVADGSAGLSIFDVSNPSNPQYIRSHLPIGNVNDIVIEGSYAYLALDYGGMEILDLSNPTEPSAVSRIPLVGQSYGLDLQETVLFVGGTGGVRIVDVSEPESPIEIAYDMRFPLSGIHNRGQYIYAASWSSGLLIFNRYCGDFSDDDKDGLPNSWESCGYEYKGVYVDLPAMGADPQIPDIFVEVDYMDDLHHCIKDVCLFGHTHQPTQQLIDLVVEAFDKRGIHLHVDFGDDALLHPSAQTDEYKQWRDVPGGSGADELDERELILSGSRYDNSSWEWYVDTKESNFRPERFDAFIYALFGHGITDTKTDLKGAAPRVPASELIVGMRDNNDLFFTAAVFMHELGHTLDLCHGGPRELVGILDEHGDLVCPGFGYVPNLFSVMSYAYTKSGIVTNSRRFLDYSDSTRLSNGLSESDLAEWIGLNQPALDEYKVNWCFRRLADTGKILHLTFNANGWIDWNCNLWPDVDTVQADISDDGDKDDFVLPYDDWTNIKLGNGCIGFGDYCLRKSSLTLEPAHMLGGQNTDFVFPDIQLEHDLSVEAATSLVTDPGVSLTIPLTITNSGSLTSTYRLSETIESSWFDISGLPSEAILSSGISETYDLVLNVPSDANSGFEEILEIELNVEEDPASTEVLRFQIVIEPYAWFSVRGNVGKAPLVVQFSDLSVADIDTWLWDFGDGSMSNEQNPTHTYSIPGMYSVSLTVTGNNGSDTDTKTNLIRVEPIRTFLPAIRK